MEKEHMELSKEWLTQAEEDELLFEMGRILQETGEIILPPEWPGPAAP